MKKLILLVSLFALTTPSVADDLTAVVTNSQPGLATGSINLTVNGGVAPYTFSWTGPNGITASSEDISNLIAGEYTVIVTDKYCGVATLTLKVSTTTGIESSDNQISIAMVPNPVTDLLTIQSSAQLQHANIRFMTINGKIVQHEENLNGEQFRINVSNLSSGLYFIEVYTDHVVCKSKFVKN